MKLAFSSVSGFQIELTVLAKRTCCYETSRKWLDLKTLSKTLNAFLLKVSYRSHFSLKKLIEVNALSTLVF